MAILLIIEGDLLLIIAVKQELLLFLGQVNEGGIRLDTKILFQSRIEAGVVGAAAGRPGRNRPV